MASVNETVRESMLQFPMLFPNRSQVLYHMLCVNGSGAEWVNGEAVSLYQEEHWTPEQELAERARNNYSEEVLELLKPVHEQDMLQNLNIVNNIEVLQHLTGPIRGEFYPQCEYALLMNIPDDVTADWAAACEEIKTQAKANGWVFDN
jgi:hypothetical protein